MDSLIRLMELFTLRLAKLCQLGTSRSSHCVSRLTTCWRRSVRQPRSGQRRRWRLKWLSDCAAVAWGEAVACCAGGSELSRAGNWVNGLPSQPHLLFSLRLRTQLGDTVFGVRVRLSSEHRMMLLLPLHCTLLRWKLWFPRRRNCHVCSKLGFWFI